MQSGRQSRISRFGPWHMPGPCWRQVRLRCCWWSPSQGVQRDHVSQPTNDSQLGISQASLTNLGPEQLSGPRHSLVLVRTPTPQVAEHSDHSVQQDHWPSTTLLTPVFARHGCILQILLCVARPLSQGGDSHCLTYEDITHVRFLPWLRYNKTTIDTYPLLRTPSARTITRTPRRPLAPTVLVNWFRVSIHISVSPQTRSVISAITFFLFGKLYSHARRILRLRAATESKTLFHVTHAAAL